MSNTPRIWFLLGAGTSAGAPSSISLWGEICADTQQFLYKTLEYKVRATGGDGYLHARDALQQIAEQAYPETILECLTRVYGRSGVANVLRSVLSPSDAAPNICHRVIAQLCKQGRATGIMTTNFDVLQEKALEEENVAYRVVSPGDIHAEGYLPVIKLHGTIDDASSLVFTRNEYYLGICQSDIEALWSRMAKSHLVIVGYSGNDIDVFPVIRSMINEGCFSCVTILDRAPLTQNKRYNALQRPIEYSSGPAEESLCRLAGMPVPSTFEERKRRISAVVPSDDKYSAALFFGDCLLSLGLRHDLAFNLFFLTQDIVEEETGDVRQLCVSLFAKSCALAAMGDNTWAESEYSGGRTQLHNLLANSNLPAQREMLSEFSGSLAALEIQNGVQRVYGASGFASGRLMPKGSDSFDDSTRGLEFLRTVLHWELRARIGLCFAAFGTARDSSCQAAERQEMMQVPEKLMYGFRNWESHFPGHSRGEEFPLIPSFYSRFFRAYQRFLLQDQEATSDLDACVRMAKRGGFHAGVAQSYFLKKTFGVALAPSELRDYTTIQELCGINERTMLAPLFRAGRAFKLSITNYRPPV